MSADAQSRDIYSVSRLNSEIRYLLEGSFPLLWLEGEISNLATPRSGHAYFSLKDAHAQVRCALFRGKRQLLRFQPEDGDQVLVRARISLYEARGEFQLIIEHMEPSGEGALQRAFEELKNKLSREGLFDTDRKQALPAYPKKIGVITSPTGAALRDILHVLKRRAPGLPIVVYPAAVQGEQAPSELTRALQFAEQRAECDVLILARGGGSLEDLAAFNDEALARTVAKTTIPVISAVGHEVDFSITDFVADLRAPTPSAAAELATPDLSRFDETLEKQLLRLRRSLHHRMEVTNSQLHLLRQKLQLLHPAGRLRQQQQQLDDLDSQLVKEINDQLKHRQQAINYLSIRLKNLAPKKKIQALRTQCQQIQRQLQQTARIQLEQKQVRVAALARELNAISPLQTLVRGYSITQLAEDGTIIRSAESVQPGLKIETQLHEGVIISTVDSTR